MTLIDTKTVQTIRPGRQLSLLQRLSIWHRAWVELYKFRQLDPAALRDMGIDAEARDRVRVSEIAARIRSQSC